MVKRTSGGTRNLPRRSSARSIGLELMMDCQNEDLSPAQLQHMKKCRLEFDNAMAMIKAAQAKARAGKATVSVQKVHMKNIPPPKAVAVPGGPQKQAQRSTSPDVIFVGESPPPPTQKTVPKSAPQLLAKPAAITNAVQTNAPVVSNIQPATHQFIIRGNALGNAVQGPLRLVPLNTVNQYQQRPPVPVQFQVPRQNATALHAPQRLSQPGMMSATSMLVNSAIMAKRHLESTQDSAGPARKKLKKPGEVLDNIGSWVPLDEYYYGKMEGDPSYREDKGEYRFKCWYCSKMLYNNIKAMMHIQGHIDSGKQHNLDLSDLTQCKHCYKQFDTPFEMQTHVEKVHMNGANVLLCRICERDHESRTALTHHMRQNHNACEMPYICHLCNFRSSMYSDVVDHFKKKHDSSPHILCLYCLKVFKVKFVTLGWGQTQTYYGHLLKHQSKASTKKCTLCRLTFYNVPDVKAHKKKDHQANHKGVLGPNNRYSTPGQVMIKVPESGLQPKPQSVKSLNAPAVSKVLDFGGTRFPTVVNYLTCLECKMSMGTPDHFKKYIECSMCRFATSCSIAYANHMMGFHSCQVSSLNLNIPWERRMESPMYCLCGFGSRYGNKIANHLVYCTKRTCYLSKPDLPMSEEGDDEDTDPRRKPGASILDVLGLVKKRTVTTKEEMTHEVIRRPSWDEPPVLTNMKAESLETVDSAPSHKTEMEDIPPELTGMQKWTTVKIKDSAIPSKTSVFLGVDDMKMSEEEDDEDRDVSLSDELKATLQNIVDDNIDESKPETKGPETLDSESATVTNSSDKMSGEGELDESGDKVVKSSSVSDETITLLEDDSVRSEVGNSDREREQLNDKSKIGGDVSKPNDGFDSAIVTKEKLKDDNVDNLDDKEIDELLKDENEDKVSSNDEMEAVLDSKISEDEEKDLLEDSGVQESVEGKGDNSHNKGDNTDIDGKDDVAIFSQGEEEMSAASEGSHNQDKISQGYTENSNSKTDKIDSPEANMDTIEHRSESEVCEKNSPENVEGTSNAIEGENISEDTNTESQLSKEFQSPEMSSEDKVDAEVATQEQMETDTCHDGTENIDSSEEKVEEKSASVNESEDISKEKDSSSEEKGDNSKDKGDDSTTPKKEDNSQERESHTASEEKGDNSKDNGDDSTTPKKEDTSQERESHTSSEEKGDNSRNKGDNSNSEGRGDNSRPEDRKSSGDSYRHHSRDRDHYDDKERSRNRDSRYDDRSSKSDYRDNRSQGNYRSHGDHHGDRSHDSGRDWDRNHGRSSKDDRNWRHSDSRNYHGNQDHHSYQGHRDNRNYHGKSQYSRDGRDDRRQGNYHDNYQSNRNHGNFRGGRGGYGNRGGYQGNHR